MPLTTSRASLVRRFVAYALDCTLLLAGLIVFQLLIYRFNPLVEMSRRGVEFSGGQLHLWVFVTATVPFVLYFATMIASPSQATLGMRGLKLQVQDLGGRRVSLARALVRSAVLLAPFELNHALMFRAGPPPGESPGGLFWLGVVLVWTLVALYVIAAMGSKTGQSIHDRIAGTVVVSTKL